MKSAPRSLIFFDMSLKFFDMSMEFVDMSLKLVDIRYMNLVEMGLKFHNMSYNCIVFVCGCIKVVSCTVLQLSRKRIVESLRHAYLKT